MWMWSYARVEFGMRCGEFLRLTFRQFDALKRRHEEQQKRRDGMLEYMLGQLTAVVGNTGFRTYKDPVKTTDFMPSQREQQDQVRKVKRVPKKARVDNLRKTMMMLAGMK